MKNKLSLIFTAISLFLISCSEDNSPIDVPQPEGAVLAANVGGPAEPNQVWVDLDTQQMKTSRRDDWDFGFSCTDDFYVILNNSIMMAAGKIDATNIDLVTTADVAAMKPLVAVGTFEADNTQYVDAISGIYSAHTAIEPISNVDTENKVYLINMGYSVYNGSDTNLNSAGNPRGWKKVRILREGNQKYKIQYADISSSTHQEYIVEKNSNYLFTFLSLANGVRDIQPQKDNWDLCFTVFTNENVGYGTYIFADFVTTNVLNNTGAYMVSTAEVGSYDDFTKNKIDYTKFVYNDQRIIGSSWRQTYGGASVFNDRFYIIKDHLGTVYKLKFLTMTNTENLRGYPSFEYDVLF